MLRSSCLCCPVLTATALVLVCRIPKEKYFPVPGVDGALVTFKLLPPGKRLKVPDERGFISMVSLVCGHQGFA
jgi:hypothetical protein